MCGGAIPSEVLNQLYAIWLDRSFEEHLSCWVADEIADEMYIDIPEGFRKIRLEGQRDQFRDSKNAERLRHSPP
jgi:hypothetical protein